MESNQTSNNIDTQNTQNTNAEIIKHLENIKRIDKEIEEKFILIEKLMKTINDNNQKLKI